MKKYIIHTSSIFVILVLILINQYMIIEYNANLIEYFQKSNGYTKEETQWMLNHGPIIFGSDQSSPPLRYIDGRNDQYKGLIIDYIRALSIELKHEISFEPVAVWSHTFDNLKGKEKDFFDMIPSESRAEVFKFSNPIYSLQGVILKPKGNLIETYYDLRGTTVAIPDGDYAIEFISRKLPKLNIIPAKNMEEAMIMLRDGHVGAVIGDEPVIVYLQNALEMKDEFVTTKPIYKEPAVLAVRKSDEILISILNKGIFNLKRKNVMSDLQQKWFGIGDDFSNKADSEKLTLIIIGGILFVMLMFYLAYSWNRTLKLEVDKRTEELYQSRQKMKVTLDGLPNPIAVIDKTYKIVNCNKVFCATLDCKRKEAMGRSIIGLNDLLSKEPIRDLVNEVFESNDQQRREIQSDNATYIISAFPISDRTYEHHLLVMIEDVTRIKIAEQRMLQDSKMKSVGVLAAGVAHEIRNPLGLIGHYSYILRANKGKDEVRQEKALTVIENSVKRASHIIDNLLNFSRITSDHARNRNMKEFINNILLLEEKAMMGKEISYQLTCPEDLVCGIRLEPFKHILINLISNAIDAMEHKGHLTIECDLVSDKIVLFVKDNGKGIDAESLEEIYMPFFTTKESGKGTGLGMYIVYNEISKYGGCIKVNSTLGLGTIFAIELPNQEVV